MDELKNVLMKSVPYLGSIIGTVNPIAGVLFNSIAHLFGLNSNVDPSTLASTIVSDPDHDVKLRSLEIQHAKDILDSETQIRMGAYNREIEVTKATGHVDNVLTNLAYIFVVGFFIYAVLLFFVHVDSTVHDIVLLLAGQISSLALCVGNYFFGAMFKPKIIPSSVPNEVVLPPPAKTR